MSHIDEWNGISVRIQGLQRAGELYLLGLARGHVDGGKTLVTQAKSVVDAIAAYHAAWKSALPIDAQACIENFVKGETVTRIKSERDDPRAPLIWLSAFETEMSFILSGRQELIRVRSERAFLHLQWLLAVDAELRDWWQAAYDESGEVRCEQLGAVHLLWHGIYAFKAHTPPARTDLVFGEPIGVGAERAVEGFVLTEWKTGGSSNALTQFEDARSQLQGYTRGPLGGTELTGYRYAILVSEEQLPPACIPADMMIDGIIYRHINIAITPRPPSREARARRSRSSRR